MPRLIQSQARGLLSLLTSKDGGLGPNAMEDTLRVTLESRDFYGLNGRRQINIGQTAAQLDASPAGWVAAGGVQTEGWFPCVPGDGSTGPTDLRVPEGELWRVLGVQFAAERINGSVVLGAGWAHGMFPTWSCIQVGPLAPAVLAGQQQTAGGTCDFMAPPGSAPAFFANAFDLGVFDFDLEVYVVYERIPL